MSGIRPHPFVDHHRRIALSAWTAVAVLLGGAVAAAPAAASTPAPTSPPESVAPADWGTAPLPYDVVTAWESDESEQAVLVVKVMNLDDVAVVVEVDSPFGPSKEPVTVPADESRELRILAGQYHVSAGELSVEVRPAGWGTADPLTVESTFASFSALRPPTGDTAVENWIDSDDGLVRIGGSFTNTGPHAVQARLQTDGHGSTDEQTVAPGATAQFELRTGRPSVPALTPTIVATKTIDGETLSSTFRLDTPVLVNEPPALTISGPGVADDVIGRFVVTGAVSDDYGLSANGVTATLHPAADDGTSGPAVETVAAPVDGDAWSATFNALDLPAGPYRIVVTTVDNAGQESTVERQVTVLEAPAHRPGTAMLSDDNAHDGIRGGAFTVTANLWWGQNGTTFRLYENGELVTTRELTDATPVAQAVSVPVTGKPNGTYVYTCELENARGVTACGAHTVQVTHAAPAVPVLRHDNWDGNGDFAVTADLSWGTNATSWTLFEDGVAIESGDLVAATPAAQRVTVPLAGREVGTHVYRIEFANALGTTTSRNLEVRVR